MGWLNGDSGLSMVQHKSAMNGGCTTEEKRSPAHVEDPQCIAADGASDDDKNSVVLTTAELTPWTEDHDEAPTAQMLAHIITSLQAQNDWLIQQEAIVTLRRLVVHHTSLITDQQIAGFVHPLTLACDNLRSALSKNALLAFAECFEFLGNAQLEKYVSSSPGGILDVLLRRSACEKKFLRDAAKFAVRQLAHHMASLRLLVCAAAYATAKNARLCGNAAQVVSSALVRLKSQPDWSVDRDALHVDNGKHIQTLCRALVTFRGGKDSTARTEATACFVVLGELLGQSRLEELLKNSISNHRLVTTILNEVFANTQSGQSAQTQNRRGSLRQRIMQEAS